MERPEAVDSLCCSQVPITNTAILQWILAAVREKEGLSVASNSFKDGSEVDKNSCFSKLSVNNLSPSGIYEELTLTVKVDFSYICFEM